MKKKVLISIIGVLTVLVVAYVVFGQEPEQRRQRFAQMRETQMKAVDAILEQAAKLKEGMKEPAFDQSRLQGMSDEEREKFREERMKARETQQATINMIITQVALLQGQMQPAEGERYILVNTADLKAVHALALNEKATQTAERITALLEPPQRVRGLSQPGGPEPGPRPKPQREPPAPGTGR